jgi:precorrin-3B synthase
VHTAADGELARVRLPGGAVTAAQLRELADCAEELGAGVIELTSRANVQVRGLRSAPDFAGRMAAAGLLPSATHERVRNIIASPLAGRAVTSLADVRPLVAALDAELRARPRLAELPGRFLFALDDGTGDVAGLGADVGFLAGAGSHGILLLAGEDAGLDVTPADAVALMIAAATAFLDERAAQGTAAWRIAELEDGARLVAARLPGAPATRRTGPLPPARRRSRAGTLRQLDGRLALEVVVPLGRLRAAQARALADAVDTVRPAARSAADTRPADTRPAAARAGGEAEPEVRLSPWRTVVLPDLSPAEAARWAGTLVEAGLVTAPSSPWEGLTACTGRPGCARSLADVQADAAEWAGAHPGREPHAQAVPGTSPGAAGGADERGFSGGSAGGVEEQNFADGSAGHAGLLAASLEGQGPPVHWSGCERRCGRPRGRVIDVVATGDGYRVELDGDSRTCDGLSETAAAVAAAREET